MPTIDPDKVRYVIEKAREFDAGVETEDDELHAVEPHDVDDPIEDDPDIAKAPERDPFYDAAHELIQELNEDEQIELVALAWIGRGSFAAGEWDQALEEAANNHNDRTAEYLLGLPLLGDYLAEGLTAFGISTEE